MNRRGFLLGMGAVGAGAAGMRWWPEDGIWNACQAPVLPPELASHSVIRAAWVGLDPARVWDSHVHLIGAGDSDSGIWVNPAMQSLLHPIQYVQFRFYLNASCPSPGVSTDAGYVDRLMQLNRGMARGSRLMLLAFDYHHDQAGRQMPELSPFHTPDAWAARIVAQHPEDFEWIASIHPYREDCVQALEWAVARRARAVKWLPGAMGIDPSSPACDRFYEACRRLDVPLLVHAGSEYAVHVEGMQDLGNPLLLRRPLEQGVRVIIAHCASLGSSADIDRGPDGPKVRNFDLFARLMDTPAYEKHLYGDISAVTQINRDITITSRLIERQAWHARLLNGSDYPLPGIMPLISVRSFASAGWLDPEEAPVIARIRRYNPLLFDLVLKRRLRVNGLRFADAVFETQRVFAPAGQA